MGFSIAVTLGWCLALLVHLNTLRRTALSITKDTLISNIYDLLNSRDGEKKSIDELYFDHKIIRIERKIIELNAIYNGKLLLLSDEPIKKIITFDIEEIDNNEDLKLACYEAIEHIDAEYHKHIHNNLSFFYVNRYEIGGVFFISASLYMLIKIVYWVYAGEI